MRLERLLASSKVLRAGKTQPHISVQADKCTGCGRCVEVCPSGSWTVRSGKAWPRRPDLCLECGACYHVCPSEAVVWRYPEGGEGVIYRF